MYAHEPTRTRSHLPCTKHRNNDTIRVTKYSVTSLLHDSTHCPSESSVFAGRSWDCHPIRGIARRPQICGHSARGLATPPRRYLEIEILSGMVLPAIVVRCLLLATTICRPHSHGGMSCVSHHDKRCEGWDADQSRYEVCETTSHSGQDRRRLSTAKAPAGGRGNSRSLTMFVDTSNTVSGNSRPRQCPPKPFVFRRKNNITFGEFVYQCQRIEWMTLSWEP